MQTQGLGKTIKVKLKGEFNSFFVLAISRSNLHQSKGGQQSVPNGPIDMKFCMLGSFDLFPS